MQKKIIENTLTLVVSLQESKTWIHSQDSHWSMLIDPLLVLTWLLPMQMTDFFAAKMVMLYCWSALWVTKQRFRLQTDISHSSWMEQFTDMVVMLHSSSDWFEIIWDKMRTGFGTAPGGSKNDWSQLVWFGFLCNPKFNRDLIWMRRAHAQALLMTLLSLTVCWMLNWMFTCYTCLFRRHLEQWAHCRHL